MLENSVWPCQQHSRNLWPAFPPNLVYVYSDDFLPSSERLDPPELRDADGARAGQLQRLQGDPPVRHLAAPVRQGAVLRTGQTLERTFLWERFHKFVFIARHSERNSADHILEEHLDPSLMLLSLVVGQ